MKFPSLLLILCSASLTVTVLAQKPPVTYQTEVSSNVGSGEFAPFWLVTNQQGIPNIQPNSAYARLGIFQHVDSTRRFSYQYGLDLVKETRSTSEILAEQAFVGIRYRQAELNIGSRIRTNGLENPLLSSCGGGTLWSENARPLPEVEFAIPDFVTVFHRLPWLKAKLAISYGWLVDNGYQLQTVNRQNGFVSINGFLHRKSLALQFKGRSRWSFIASGEIDVQFAGKQIYYVNGKVVSSVQDPADLKHFLMVFIPFKGDKSATVSDQEWFYGNYVGNWQGRLTYDMGSGGQLHAYLDNYFEDSSGFWKLNGLDGLWGIEYDAAKRGVITGIVVEYYQSTNQSGSIFFQPNLNPNSKLTHWCWGGDNYYNHGFYIGWSNYGRAMGSPLVTSPAYNNNGNLTFEDNRVRAYHLGIMGSISAEWSDRLLATYREGFGTMDLPFINPLHGFSGLAEISYAPKKVSGLTASVALGYDHGGLTGNNWGFQLSVKKSGILGRLASAKHH
ncbi:MAG: hypothetical protein ACP5F6_07745 [Microbacter sp.]